MILAIPRGEYSVTHGLMWHQLMSVGQDPASAAEVPSIATAEVHV